MDDCAARKTNMCIDTFLTVEKKIRIINPHILVCFLKLVTYIKNRILSTLVIL
jgi:hypothetical protein